MKKHWLLVALSIMMIGLLGCGEDEEKAVEEKEAVVTEEESESEPALGNVNVEPSVIEKLSGDGVVGNGEFFIKIGDRIYFRKYGKDALCEAVMGGDFHSYFVEDGTRQICYVKKGDTKVHEAFYDTGFGELYYYDGLFYLKDDLGTYTIDKDGDNKEYLNLGEDMASFESIYDHYMFYTDLVGSDVTLFVKDLDNDEEGTPIYCLDIENELGWPTIEQAEVHGDDAYIGISYIDGSGNFFQGGEIIKTPVDGSDLEGEVVQDIEIEYDEDSEYLLAMKRFTVDDDGTVNTYSHLPGSVWVDMGDLYIANDDGEERLYMEDFERDPIGGIYEITEQVCMLDGEVYAINNLMVRSPQDDIGWREYYKDLRSTYLKIDVDDDLQELCRQDVSSGDMAGFIYLLQETGENDEHLILLDPSITVSREETELCDLYGLDPDDPDLFFDDYELVEPYFGDGYIFSISDDLSFQIVDYESDTFSRETDLDEFISYVDPGDWDYEKVHIEDLEYNEYNNMYEVPKDDLDNDIYYSAIYGKLIFNDDFTEVERIEEIYLP